MRVKASSAIPATGAPPVALAEPRRIAADFFFFFFFPGPSRTGAPPAAG